MHCHEFISFARQLSGRVFLLAEPVVPFVRVTPEFHTPFAGGFREGHNETLILTAKAARLNIALLAIQLDQLPAIVAETHSWGHVGEEGV